MGRSGDGKQNILWGWPLLLLRAWRTKKIFEGKYSRGGTPYNGLYGEAPPERGTFFMLQVYKRVGISQIGVYKRVGKSVI